MTDSEKIEELVNVSISIIEELKFTQAQIETLANKEKSLENTTEMLRQGKTSYEIMESNISPDMLKKLNGYLEKVKSLK